MVVSERQKEHRVSKPQLAAHTRIPIGAQAAAREKVRRHMIDQHVVRQPSVRKSLHTTTRHSTW
jgi:hypothetical protein